MMPEIQNIDIVALIGRDVPLRKVSAHEWASPCPRCGGRDRFRVNDQKKGFFCRHCIGEPGSGGKWGDAVDYLRFAYNISFREALQRLHLDRRATTEEIEQMQAERRRAEEEQRKQEREEQARVQLQLNQNPEWWAYHHNLFRYPEAVQMWHDRGLSDAWINYYGLGYCPQRQWYVRDDKSFESASLTIPYLNPQFCKEGDHEEFKGWRITALQHRLLIENPPGGKYRPHLAGAGKQLFFTDVFQRNVMGDLLIVEGEVKAMVTWASLWIDGELIAPNLTVVGVPGHGWREEWLEQFRKAERSFVCLDPDADAQKAAKRLLPMLNKPKNILLPDKIDDLINAGVLNGWKLLSLMEG